LELQPEDVLTAEREAGQLVLGERKEGSGRGKENVPLQLSGGRGLLLGSRRLTLQEGSGL